METNRLLWFELTFAFFFILSLFNHPNFTLLDFYFNACCKDVVHGIKKTGAVSFIL